MTAEDDRRIVYLVFEPRIGALRLYLYSHAICHDSMITAGRVHEGLTIGQNGSVGCMQ